MPQILRLTRVTETSATLIDHVWINDETMLINSGIIKCTISDHFSVFIEIIGGSSSEPKAIGIYHTKQVLTDERKQNFTNNLTELDLDLVLDCTDANAAYDMFIQNITHVFNIHFSIIQKRKKKRPYITNEIKTLIKEKHRLQRLYFKWPITYEKQYKNHRNLVNNKIRLAKKRYYYSRLNLTYSNTKLTWNVMNELIRHIYSA